MSYDIVKKQSYTTIGLKWEGTFAEARAGGIRSVMKELHMRMNEIKHIVDSQSLIGLSYDAHPGNDRFTHYSVVEVEKTTTIPDGMVTIRVPDATFVRTEHVKGENIATSYHKIHQWIIENGYEATAENLTHVEIYPAHQDSYGHDPEFTIMVPIVGKIM